MAENKAMSELDRFHLKKFVKELEKHRGRHTELVSVYVSSGYDLNLVINQLSQEQGTASNIKSKQTRDNVTTALEKMIQHLRLFKQTPPNGLAVFSGNVAEREGQQDFKVWSIEPPIPIKLRTYRCDKEFLLDPLREFLESKEVYALVVFDRRDAMLALLKGKTIIPIRKTHSEVPGKMRAGGQCLVNDSLVQLSDGSLPRIQTIHNPHVVKSVMIMNGFKIRSSNVTDKWKTKKKQVYRIVTKNPRLDIQSSKDHIFFVTTSKGIEGKTAEQLKQGDYLIMPEKIDVKGKIQRLKSKIYYNSFTITEKGREFLKKKRVSKKLSQHKLARLAGLAHQTSVSILERGVQNCTAAVLKKLCRGLDLDFEDFVMTYTVPYKRRIVVLPKVLNETFAQFLGYFLGDGSIETDRITFFEQDAAVALAYQQKFDRFFKISSSYKFRDSKNYHQIRFTSRPLVRLVKKEFPELRKSLDSEIPQKILLSNNKTVAAFLKGFFDAEGYVHRSRRGVALGINNKKLAQQIQLVLLRFSILSSLHEYDNRANNYSDNPRFTVDITEKKSLELFKKHIGFIASKKSERLSIILKNKSDTSYTRQIIAPGKKIRKLIAQAGYNLQSFPKVSNFFRNERMIGKDTFKSSVLANVKDKRLYRELKAIHDYPVLPVRISNVERTGKMVEMTDISVKNQNFIANGVLVHNSAPRFQRLREGAAKDHYKKIAEYMKDEFLKLEGLKGIIIGGPGVTVNDFMGHDYLTGDLKKKIIGTKDLSYTGEFGLQELLEKSEDLLASEEVSMEKQIVGRFLNMLAKEPGKVSYGKEHVLKLLGMGAVDILLLSEALDDDELESLEEKAKELGTEVRIISTETREGVQLRDLGKVAAILRYDVGES